MAHTLYSIAEPLNNIVLVSRAYLQSGTVCGSFASFFLSIVSPLVLLRVSHQTPAAVAPFSRQAYVAGDVLRDSAARDEIVPMTQAGAPRATSTDQRNQEMGRLFSVSGIAEALVRDGVMSNAGAATLTATPPVAPAAARSQSPANEAAADEASRKRATQLEDELDAWRSAGAQLLGLESEVS